MDVLFVVLAFVGWLGLVVLVGKLCALTDDHPRPFLTRRPNIRLVQRDEEDTAA